MGIKTLNFLKNKDAAIETTSIVVKSKENAEKTTTKKANKTPKVKRYEDGLWKVIHNEDTDDIIKLERISTPINILALTRTEDSLDWGMLLELTDNDQKKHLIVMKNSQLDRPGNEWLKLLKDDGGIWVKPDGVSFVKDFLATANDYTQKLARLATKTGWSDDAKTFALPHTSITSDTEEAAEMVVMQQSTGTAKMYKESGTLEEWKANVAAKSVGNSRLTFMMCAALTGPLLYLVSAENGGFHIVGSSSQGKSTALRMAASIWGDQKGHFKSWRTTDNAAEGLAVFNNDSCLILDEVGEASAKALEVLAYMLANGSGKARAGRDGQVRAIPTWRTTFLSSGEVTLSQKLAEGGLKARAGQEVRFAEIIADAGAGKGVFDDCKGMRPNDFAMQIMESAEKYYGTAGPAFIKALMKIKEINCKISDISNNFAKTVCEKDADGQVLRVARRFGMCLAAGKIAVEYGIFPHTEENIEISVKKCFESWLEMRGGQGAGEDREIIKTIKLFIELHGQSRFQNLHPRTDQDGQEIEQICHNRCGFRDGDKFYILEEAWEKEIFKGFNIKKAAKILRKEEILRCQEFDHYKTKKVLPGLGKVPCYIIKMDTSDIKLATSEQTKTLETQANLLEGMDNKIEGIPTEEFFGEILNGMQ